VKRLMWFAQEVLKDLGTWCDTSTTRDEQTVARRYEHEGVEFLTLTLPEYGKAFERALSDAQFDPSLGKVFHFRGRLPAFLSGFVDQVFDRKTGALLPEPSTVAIWAIRQFTLMFAKIVPPANRGRDSAAIAAYVECEQDVRQHAEGSGHFNGDQFHSIGSMLWARILTNIERRVLAVPSGIIPKHGPGATADLLRGNAKWRQSEWTDRLEAVFPVTEHLISSWSSIPELTEMTFLEPGQERPSKVVLVPKTWKTPRIIAEEPTCMQFMQQGLLSEFVVAIESNDTARQLIGWQSAEANNLLACQGSRDGSLATLDLSEASDRVSYQHVRELLRAHPHLFSAVDACRSQKADVLGHGVVTLAKFASMGSALTFPLEAMVFLTVVFQGIANTLNAQLTPKLIKSFVGRVRVYGDDIIVPTEYVSPVIESLEAHGLKVNTHKSFWTGKFRESCGKEYYDGTDVSLVRVRHVFPSNRQHGEEILSVISLRNQLYFAGLWRAARWVDELLDGINVPMPVVLSTSPIQGRQSFLGYDTSVVERMHPDYQHPLVKGVVESSTKPISELNGAPALLKVLTAKQVPNQQKEVEHDSFFGWGHEQCSCTGPRTDLESRFNREVVLDPRDRVRFGIWKRTSRDSVGTRCRNLLCATEARSEGHDHTGTGESRTPDVGMGLRRRALTELPVVSHLDDVILGMLHGESPTVDVMHLHRAGRPRRVSIKLRWRTPW